MTSKLKALESAAMTAQQSAARAWTDLRDADDSSRAEMQVNYDRALAAQNETYSAWVAAQ